MKIQMVDLQSQYQNLKPEIDAAIAQVLTNGTFINGPEVERFALEFATYNQVAHVVPCANGTDALQLALMALELEPGDEVIVPAFTYVATAEAIALLGLTPVFADVDPHTFLLTPASIAAELTSKTKAIIAVHLFGQCADMAPILDLAVENGLYVIEDTAQAIGADYQFPDGSVKKAGTIGHIGTTSFFPSKNLGCYGDGGALLVQDTRLAAKLKMLANHGQKEKYYHDLIGINSRLDTLQAAILSVKLRHLDTFCANRRQAAAFYDAQLAGLEGIVSPARAPHSTHVYHQYTLTCSGISRDELRSYLQHKGIPSMVYYPVPLHQQKAYVQFHAKKEPLPVSEKLSEQVLSLPIHTEQNEEQLNFITASIKEFVKMTIR